MVSILQGQRPTRAAPLVVLSFCRPEVAFDPCFFCQCFRFSFKLTYKGIKFAIGPTHASTHYLSTLPSLFTVTSIVLCQFSSFLSIFLSFSLTRVQTDKVYHLSHTNTPTQTTSVDSAVTCHFCRLCQYSFHSFNLRTKGSSPASVSHTRRHSPTHFSAFHIGGSTT